MTDIPGLVEPADIESLLASGDEPQVTAEERIAWADKRADDAGRCARDLLQVEAAFNSAKSVAVGLALRVNAEKTRADQAEALLSRLTAPVEMETSSEERADVRDRWKGCPYDATWVLALLRDFDRLAALLAAAEARAVKAEAALKERIERAVAAQMGKCCDNCNCCALAALGAPTS